jgi:hypothetical protein
VKVGDGRLIWQGSRGHEYGWRRQNSLIESQAAVKSPVKDEKNSIQLASVESQVVLRGGRAVSQVSGERLMVQTRDHELNAKHLERDGKTEINWRGPSELGITSNSSEKMTLGNGRPASQVSG